ncbi:DUF3788 domain-containing protein [Desulfoscipio gibsoniae]|uniref:DUF3788 domain-containing protein n=1 Tax=Desulfoscipio gibsoniae DSM 7213 TaxID=767817 RepID=R4KPR5_9FIRM|nr:DUF3788 domain-containing protein [Desulfoscipio gibsoniae]AGL03512.1 hypothetical protein Desgi_4266 [Desulfoscipio gibsoniae DSM 7213]
MWSELYNQDNQPTLQDINDYVNCELWPGLCSFLESTYNVVPKLEYSKCSMQKGWNVKYKKGSKSLCTLYPMNGYFIALIVIGKKEQIDSELIMPSCNAYVQRLFSKTAFSAGGKWLMIEVRERTVLEDVLKLIQLRVKPKKKSLV